jgi:hypothetical protein
MSSWPGIYLMGMGLPHKGELVDILKETYTEQEAEIALMLPTTNTPPKAGNNRGVSWIEYCRSKISG